MDMRFDTNDTGKYSFDSRQNLTGEELSRLEDEYTARLRSNPSNAFKNMSFVNVADTANQVATYVIIGLFVILPLLSWFVLFSEKPNSHRTFMTIGVTLIGVGIMLFVKVILRLTVKQRVYSGTVDAECIGYARYFEASTDEGVGPVSHTPYVSPVFTYRYEGTLYTACFDGFEASKDCSVAPGPSKINISPKHPESIYSHGAQQKDVLVLFSIVFLVIGVALTVMTQVF